MIRITDGTETVEIDSIEAYVAGYGFNEPGDVEARVIDEDGETVETFLIRSEDGRRGFLVQEYASRMSKVTVAGQLVPYEAAVNLMDDDLREALNGSWTGAEDDYQGFVDAYAAAHADKFAEEFVVN